jgi:hypothetical protein
VTYADGMVRDTLDPERCLTFKQIAARQVATGGPIVGRSGVNPPGAGASMGTHIVDVEVDPETGKITILRYTAVQDAGKAIHPSYVEGQIQGGATQGVGWALIASWRPCGSRRRRTVPMGSKPWWGVPESMEESPNRCDPSSDATQRLSMVSHGESRKPIVWHLTCVILAPRDGMHLCEGRLPCLNWS